MVTPKTEPVTHPDWLSRDGTVEWADAERRLVDTRAYWVASIRTNGTPHTRPVWGIWFRDRLVLSSGGGYWMTRNVRKNRAVSVHPEETEGLVVVLEGTANDLTDTEFDWKQDALDVYDGKYGISYGEMWHHGTIEVIPERVYAWNVDGMATNRGTRFTF